MACDQGYVWMYPIVCYSSCTATTFLKLLNKKKYLSDKALLLSVCPLTVGGWLVWGRDVRDKFYEYLPPVHQKGVGYVGRGLSYKLASHPFKSFCEVNLNLYKLSRLVSLFAGFSFNLVSVSMYVKSLALV